MQVLDETEKLKSSSRPMRQMKYKVKIRRDLAEVRPEAECIDANIYSFVFGWTILECDSFLYAGEFAMIPYDPNYPNEAPPWIASGDLVCVDFAQISLSVLTGK